MTTHEITHVVRLSPERALVFGTNWNATITGTAHVLDRFIKPGVVVDVVERRIAQEGTA